MLAAYWRGQCIKEAHIPPGAMAAVGRCGQQGAFPRSLSFTHVGTTPRGPTGLLIKLGCQGPSSWLPPWAGALGVVAEGGREAVGWQ